MPHLLIFEYLLSQIGFKLTDIAIRYYERMVGQGMGFVHMPGSHGFMFDDLKSFTRYQKHR